MHYLNGQEARPGDWVVGPTHSSRGEIVTAMVNEVYDEKRGDCTCQLRIPMASGKRAVPPNAFEYRLDYADTKKLVRTDSAYRMTHAVTQYGVHDSPYFPIKPTSQVAQEVD